MAPLGLTEQIGDVMENGISRKGFTLEEQQRLH